MSGCTLFISILQGYICSAEGYVIRLGKVKLINVFVQLVSETLNKAYQGVCFHHFLFVSRFQKHALFCLRTYSLIVTSQCMHLFQNANSNVLNALRLHDFNPFNVN